MPGSEELFVGTAIRVDEERLLLAKHALPSERGVFNAWLDAKRVVVDILREGDGPSFEEDWAVVKASPIPQDVVRVPIDFSLPLYPGQVVWLVGHPKRDAAADPSEDPVSPEAMLALAPQRIVRGVLPLSIRTPNFRRWTLKSSDRVHILPLEGELASGADGLEGFSGGAVLAWDERRNECVVVAMIVGGTVGQATVAFPEGPGGTRIVRSNSIVVAIRPPI